MSFAYFLRCCLFIHSYAKLTNGNKSKHEHILFLRSSLVGFFFNFHPLRNTYFFIVQYRYFQKQLLESWLFSVTRMCILDLFIFFCFLIMNKSRYSRFVSFKIHKNNAFGLFGSDFLVSWFFAISFSEVFIGITIYFVHEST